MQEQHLHHRVLAEQGSSYEWRTPAKDNVVNTAATAKRAPHGLGMTAADRALKVLLLAMCVERLDVSRGHPHSVDMTAGSCALAFLALAPSCCTGAASAL